MYDRDQSYHKVDHDMKLFLWHWGDVHHPTTWYNLTFTKKKGKNLLFRKNWRPIYLFNLEYKVAAKCIPTRIKAHLSKPINSGQIGFIKDCYIRENINRIPNIMDSVDEEYLSSVIIWIDFEKAFDSLEWSFVERTWSVFNFGPSIIKCVHNLHKDSKRCVLNNGWTSQSVWP